jgi:chemotaxis protein CheD
MKKSHIVKIGEVCIGKNNETLKATLGSCVGIAFFWSERNLVALAHCLLPETLTPRTQIGAKYVNQAVLSIISMMKIRPENINEIKALVVGGGYMMPLSKPNQKHIGALNIEAAKKYIGESGIKIFFEDVGGNEGRQIIIECSDESFKIRKILKS